MVNHDPAEDAVYLPEILKILGWSRSKFNSLNPETDKKWRVELLDDHVIFYQHEGSPPHKRIKAFPSDLRKWIHWKISKGHLL